MECVYQFIVACIKNYELPPLPPVAKSEARAVYPSPSDAARIVDQLKLIQRTVIGGKISVSAEVFRRTFTYLMSSNKQFDSLPL